MRHGPVSVWETPGLAAHSPWDPAQGSQSQLSKPLESLLRLFKSSPLLPVSRPAAMWPVPSPQVSALACLLPSHGRPLGPEFLLACGCA